MNPCGMTRVLIPAFLAGLVVASFFGNDLAGWIAAGAIVAILAAVQKVRGSRQTCAISPVAADDRADVGALDGERTDLPSR